MTLERVSSLYETEPWDYMDQPRFLNCVCAGRTSLAPEALLGVVKDVERSVGREPNFPKGPRVIDVDILFYGQNEVSEPGLELPHPRLVERAFVLVPLEEIASTLVHPVLNLTVRELLERLMGGPSSGGRQPPGIRLWAAPISLPCGPSKTEGERHRATTSGPCSR